MLQRPLDPLANHEQLMLQQVAHEFREEVEYRDAFETYCQWYYEQARNHQMELAQMQHDIPLFHWFTWRRS